MDKASAPGAGDSRFESWAGHLMQSVKKRLHRGPRGASMTAASAITPFFFAGFSLCGRELFVRPHRASAEILQWREEPARRRD